MIGGSASRRDWAVACVTGLLLVVVLTWPTAVHPASYGRIDTGDGRYSIWNIGWIDHAILTPGAHVLDANIFHPHTGTLAYSELNLVAGLLGLPVFAATHNAIAALNSAAVIALVLSFLLMWRLVGGLTGSSGAGLCAATGFTFCPYVQAHTPHIQLLMVFAVPLVFIAFHRFQQAPGLKGATWLGAALAVAGLACAYYGIFAGLAVAAIALVFAERRPSYWLSLLFAAAVTAVIVLPIFVPYLRARAVVSAPRATTVDELREYSATPVAYLTSPGYIHEELRDGLHLFHPAAESLFPGALVLILAAIGVSSSLLGPRPAGGAFRVSAVLGEAATAVITNRRVVVGYLVVAVFACWASFGPAAGLYSALQTIVPAMGLLRAPVRLGIVTTFALSVLAGFGVRWLSRKRSWLPALLVPLMAAEVATLPWPLVQAEPVAGAYEYLAHAPAGPVVEFPFPYKRTDFHNHSRYMFTSIYHWLPLVNGYSDVIPPDFRDMAAPINAFPDPASFDLLKRLGVRYVIWHMDPRSYDDAGRQKLLERFARYQSNLRRITTDQDTWLFEIVSWP